MTKGEAIGLFLDTVAEPRSDYYYKQAMDYLIVHMPKVYLEFLEHFKQVCREFKNNVNEADKIYYIQYSLMFSHVLLHKPAYVIEAFDEDYYLGRLLGESELHINWLFQPLYDYYEELQQEGKKYIMKISPVEIDKLFFTELKKYERILISIVKALKKELSSCEEFVQLNSNQLPQFRIGAYRGESELIF